MKLDGNVVAAHRAQRSTGAPSPGTLKGSRQAAAGQAHVILAQFSWKLACSRRRSPGRPTLARPRPIPALTIVKDGPATRYVGDQATFSYKVKNTGNVSSLTIPVVTDDKCAPVTRVAELEHELLRSRRHVHLHVHHDDHRRDGR